MLKNSLRNPSFRLTWPTSFRRLACLMSTTALAVTSLAMGTVSAQTVEYFHTDALGSPVAVTDQNRVILQKSNYAPYGELLNREIENGPGYTGHVADAATQLSYMQQRYYDQGIGRFLSVDPVNTDWGPGANFNRYRYASNSPYNFTDPDGRESACISMGTTCGQSASPSQAQNAVFGLALDFTPVAGDIKGIIEAAIDPTPTNVAAAAVGLIPIVGDVAGKSLKGADKLADAAKVGNLPKAPTGPGSVPKAERDPRRFFSASESEAKRAEQEYKCATGCGTDIDASNSASHHITRHADGGRTEPSNQAEVCKECHDKIHAGRNL